MATSADEKEAVKRAYNSKAWHQKVNAMSPEQIKAIYLRLKSQGKL